MTRETDNRASTIRTRVLPKANRYWTLDDLGDPTPTELRELSRLVAAGELVRVRRGLYWRGAMTPFGMSPPPEAPAARAIVGGIGSGPSGSSAASELGLATQVPTIMTVATPCRTTAPGGLPIRFVTRASRSGRVVARLRPAEVALLEVLEVWNESVEATPEDALARIRSLVHDGTIDLSRIVRAASSEPAVVRARLRALLVALDHGELAKKVAGARTPRLSLQADQLFAKAA